MTTALRKLPVVVPETMDAEYRKLAIKLGVHAPTTENMIDVLDKVLGDLSISKYSEEAVKQYLLKVKPAGHDFVWVCAMPQFVPMSLRRKRPRYRGSWHRESQNGGIIANQFYTKPIPHAVLLTIDAIRTAGIKEGITPTFFISDFARHKVFTVQRVDPFLAVGTTDSSAFHIIERWDEPGFREEVYSSKKKAAKTAIPKTK